MKIAITSDTHLGDPNGVLIKEDLTEGDKLDEFIEKVGENDYLILLGDIFDFSICPYWKVYEIAKVFLSKIRENNLAQQIVYVPGNHDFEFWHILEHEVNIINRIKNPNKAPRQFRWSVPAVFDDRKTNAYDKFVLPDVTPKPGNTINKYGDIFLSDIISPRFVFNVAYPNVYIISNDGECVLLTHGHYLESWWSLLGDWAMKIAKNDLNLTDPAKKQLSLKEIVGINFPLNQLTSSGLGQAGPLTDIVRLIQRDVKDKKFGRLKKYLNNFDDKILDKLSNYKKYDPREWFYDILICVFKKKLIKELKKTKSARFDKHFLEEHKDRISGYFNSCLKEMDRIKNLGNNHAVNIPKVPNHIIFGHTHRPIPWNDNQLKITMGNTIASLHNTGGWLTKVGEKGKEEFCGASVFFYETGKGFYSEEVLEQ